MSLVSVLGPSESGLCALAKRVDLWLAQLWVRTKYAEAGAVIPVLGPVGWTQREQLWASAQGGNRVLFLPGKLDAQGNPTADLGSLRQPRPVGAGTGAAVTRSGNPRALWTWDRPITASIWSYDPSDPRNEEVQLRASDTLLELVMQALNAAGTGSIANPSVSRDPRASVNAGFGLELLVQFTHSEPLFDVPRDVITDVSVVVNQLSE